MTALVGGSARGLQGGAISNVGTETFTENWGGSSYFLLARIS